MVGQGINKDGWMETCSSEKKNTLSTPEKQNKQSTKPNPTTFQTDIYVQWNSDLLT